jgi:SEC-C motif-containing protein
MAVCACGTKKTYNDCCGVYISGAQNAPTAEALMRSRYTAYTRHEIDYIAKTHDPKSIHEFDKERARQWAASTNWLGLEILRTVDGKAEDESGVVEFAARFKPLNSEQEETHHEVSVFRHDAPEDGGAWFYVDGKTVRVPVTRAEPKIGRNDPCSCGSGKKHKKCCGA